VYQTSALAVKRPPQFIATWRLHDQIATPRQQQLACHPQISPIYTDSAIDPNRLLPGKSTWRRPVLLIFVGQEFTEQKKMACCCDSC
jgi:hypothetical protein